MLEAGPAQGPEGAPDPCLQVSSHTAPGLAPVAPARLAGKLLFAPGGADLARLVGTHAASNDRARLGAAALGLCSWTA